MPRRIRDAKILNSRCYQQVRFKTRKKDLGYWPDFNKWIKRVGSRS